MWPLLLAGLAHVALSVPDGDRRGDWWQHCGESRYEDAGQRPLDSMIISGQDARDAEFPWTGSLRRYGLEPEDQYCGVILVHPDFVITAAHCVAWKDLEDFTVVLGENRPWEPSSTRRFFKPVVAERHEEYNREAWYDSDIAIVKLNATVNVDQHIRPVCAPPDLDETYDGWTSLISGFGSIAAGRYLLPAVQQWITLPVFERELCDWEYSSDEVTENMICAGEENNNNYDACQGDSGGPMVVQRDDKVFEVVGIVSWGRGCASGWPGVYTRVTNFRDWVGQKISELGNV